MPPSSSPNSDVTPDNAASFRTTHWSIVLAAGQQESQAATEALEKLCRAYWYPLYAYIRRRGHDIHEAEDRRFWPIHRRKRSSTNALKATRFHVSRLSL